MHKIKQNSDYTNPATGWTLKGKDWILKSRTWAKPEKEINEFLKTLVEVARPTVKI